MANNRDLFRYAGLATQFMLAIGLAVYTGFKADQKLHWKFPVGTVFFPLLMLVALFIKIFRDTNHEK